MGKGFGSGGGREYEDGEKPFCLLVKGCGVGMGGESEGFAREVSESEDKVAFYAIGSAKIPSGPARHAALLKIHVR